MTTHWRAVDERFVDDVVILDVRGGTISSRSDTPGRLLRKIEQVVGQGWLKILLNLADVRYIDGDGLLEILHGCKAVKDAGGMLKLCGLAKRLRDLLRETKIDRVIEGFESEREALQSFAAPV